MKDYLCQLRTKLLCPFLSSLLVMMLIGSISADASESVTLYTPYTKISVPPGESIDYEIDVINKSSSVRNMGISLSGLPKGWNSVMKSGGWSISQLSVLPNDKKTISLKVEVPLKVNKGSYRFYVLGNGHALLPLTVIVSEQGTYETEFTTDQPNMEGHSNSSFTFNAKLRNRTADKQLYALAANVSRGWEVRFNAAGKEVSSVNVDENGAENITIQINPPAEIKAGTYKIPVRATTNATSADLTLEVVVTGSYKMNFTTPTGLLSTSMTAGREKQIELVVKNTGSTELRDITFNADMPSDWSITFNPNKINRLNAGESTQVLAMVKASSKALAGDYIVKMTTRTPETSSNVEFRVAVKTSLLWGWMGIFIIVIACGSVYYLFRKYGRR